MSKATLPYVRPKVQPPPGSFTLIVQRTPDPPHRTGARAVVLSPNPELAGIGICQFISNLFELNESLVPSKKMTDGEIHRQIVTNYPDAKITRDLNEKKRTVHYYRDLYNRGVLTPRPGEPINKSVRYDDEGNPIILPNRQRRSRSRKYQREKRLRQQRRLAAIKKQQQHVR